jgi:tetratricopeptide (TPR) repeat protein
MFRRAATSFGKVATGLAGVQLGAAAAVALTDKELGKKPEWYQNAVRSLENSLKRLSKKGFIESETCLNDAQDALGRVSDIHNCEIQWRLARVYAEKAALSKCAHEKAHLLHDAKAAAKRALAVEPAKGSAGAHKWYAITIIRLAEIEPKTTNLDDAVKHLEIATKKDPSDPYSFTLLGIQQYNRKDYKEALESFEKAESIKAGFSANNKYYLGAALKANGKKDEAIKTLKEVLHAVPTGEFDGKAKFLAKGLLAQLGLKPEEYEVGEF